MAFKNPAINSLTESQEQLLSQLGSLKNILTNPVKKNLNIPQNKQISAFDYILKITESTIGQAFVDTLLKKFISEIFNQQSDKLERAILKGIGKSLDKQGLHASPNPDESNESWLLSNALEPLHFAMEAIKALMVKQIIGMIFGPSDKMKHNTSAPVPVPISPNPPSTNEVLNDVVAADSMFSISTSDSNEFGDIEYNAIKLKEQLEKGEVIFTISCQDVKIKLPIDFDEQLDSLISSSIMSLPGQSVPGAQVQTINPAVGFDYISNHVGKETQRINSQENSNAVKKSFLQILVEKILNLLVIAVAPYVTQILTNLNNPVISASIGSLMSSPSRLKNLQKSDPQKFNAEKEFISTMTNALYAILLAIMLKALIKEIKKLIVNALAKRAAAKLQSRLKRLSQIKKNLTNTLEKIEKAKQSAEALKELSSIFDYIKT